MSQWSFGNACCYGMLLTSQEGPGAVGPRNRDRNEKIEAQGDEWERTCSEEPGPKALPFFPRSARFGRFLHAIVRFVYLRHM